MSFRSSVAPLRGATCLVALLVAAQAQFAPQTLRVLNGTAQARVAEGTVCGFPVAESDNITSVSLFRIKDPAGVAIPAQFRPLTRWSGDRGDATKKLRWVQAAFRATVPANGSADYVVEHGTAGPAGTLTIVTGSSSIEVRNGTGGIFVIKSTSFYTPFKVVEINGQTLFNSSNGNGAVEMTSALGTTISAVPTSTVVEQSGSVMCVLRQKGTLGALKYTCRWTFFAGSLDVAMDFRLENPQAYGLFSTSVPDGQSYFDKLWLRQPFGGSSPVLTTADGTRTPSSASPWVVKQEFDWTSDPHDLLGGFNYQEKVGSTVVSSGGRHPGAFDFQTTTGGMTLAVDRFWQTFPKALKANATQLRIGLWPEWGSGPHYGGQYGSAFDPTLITDPLAQNNYRFEGGRWRAHRMLFNFRQSGSRTPAEVAAFAERAGAPLVAAPDPVRVRTSKAAAHLFVETKTWPVVELTRFEQFTAMLGDDAAADSVPNYGQVGLPAFINRAGTYGGIQTYGWDNDGDLPWADGYCAGHYDWAGSLLTGFMRTRDYKLFAQGRIVAGYRRDYGQNHSTATSENWRGAQFYEKGWWHGNYTQGQLSHNWAQGLGLLYVLTGDEGAREALIENMAFVLRDPPKTWNGLWGDRILGWAVDALLDGWAFLGDAVYLTEAGLGADRYQVLEIADGSHGYHLNPMTVPPSTKPWMQCYVVRAIARYALASGSTAHHALLGRMATFLSTTVLTPPTGPMTNRTIPKTVDQWSPLLGGVNSSVHLVWGQVDALTHVAAVNGDAATYALSKDLFDAMIRYWQAGTTTGAQNYTSPSTFSLVTMRPLQFPNSETKAVGNLMQWAAAHAALRAANEGY
jgi:hypothetical protein